MELTINDFDTMMIFFKLSMAKKHFIENQKLYAVANIDGCHILYADFGFCFFFEHLIGLGKSFMH